VTEPPRGSPRVPEALSHDGEGRLFFHGSRYLLIRPETLAGVHHALETALGAQAGEYLRAGGRAGGNRATADPAGAPRERVERLLAIGGEIGWGVFSLDALGASELVVSVRHSPFAEAYGPAREPVCHLTRGVLEALAAQVLARPARVVETACVATGATTCRFEARV
jgi:predicted hydrocarbon binding protein